MKINTDLKEYMELLETQNSLIAAAIKTPFGEIANLPSGAGKTMNNQAANLKLVSNKVRYFTSVKDPRFLETVEGFDLEDGTFIYIATEYAYDRKNSFHADRVAILDYDGHELVLSSIPASEVTYIMKEIEKSIALHVREYGDQAFNYFELDQA